MWEPVKWKGPRNSDCRPMERKALRACLKMGRGSVWEGRVRLARREAEADPQRSVTDRRRRQRVFPAWTALVRAEQTVGGLPRRSPPCPTQNSPAAEPLPIFRQALRCQRAVKTSQ
jgi:hypothetical protein